MAVGLHVCVRISSRHPEKNPRLRGSSQGLMSDRIVKADHFHLHQVSGSESVVTC